MLLRERLTLSGQVFGFSKGASLVAQMVKNLPAMQESWVQTLGWEDALEEGVATQYSILAWRIPWTEQPGRLTVLRIAKSQTQLSDSARHSILTGSYFS